MSSQRQVPVALGVVAILFLISGVASALGVFFAFFKGQLNLNLGVLGIPIFFGLRAFSRGWRTCALVFLWIGFIACSVVFVFGLFGREPANFDLFGQHIAEIPAYWASIAVVPYFALNLCLYRVLTRPDIRGLFQMSQPDPAV